MFHFCVRILLACCWAAAAWAQDAGVPKFAPEATDYTELAFKYGPFAFAILFGLVALYLIREAKSAAESGDKELEAQTGKFWIGAALVGGASLCFAGIGTTYWLRTAQAEHVFRGEIKDLSTYEQVAADDFYFRTELRTAMQGESDPLHNVHFVAIQARPFVKGQLFEIAYLKEGAAKRTTLRLAYEGEAAPAYRIEYNEQARVSELKKIPTLAQPAQEQQHAAYSPFAAYAQSLPVSKLPAMSSQIVQRSVQAPAGVDMRLVSLLQDSRTPVGAKIDALDRLNALDAASLKAYAQAVTDREPFALTLIELSRHSDKELAYKAKTLADKAGVDATLAAQLNSPTAEVRGGAQKAVLRVTPERAERIIQQAPNSARNRTLASEVQTGDKQRVLRPVGSAGGDRYYVKANWDPNNQRVVSCLTGLFQRELMSARSPQDEQKLMAGKSERLVFWYTKEWALSMADKIDACGAKASFPNLEAKK